MKCAKCDGQLIATPVGPLTIDRCERCSGIWFDGRELDRIVAHVRAGGSAPTEGAAPEEHDAKVGKCPRCGQELTREPLLSIDGLHYDLCAGCRGAWLDAGELKKIAGDAGASAELAFFNRGR